LTWIIQIALGEQWHSNGQRRMVEVILLEGILNNKTFGIKNEEVYKVIEQLTVLGENLLT